MRGFPNCIIAIHRSYHKKESHAPWRTKATANRLAGCPTYASAVCNKDLSQASSAGHRRDVPARGAERRERRQPRRPQSRLHPIADVLRACRSPTLFDGRPDRRPNLETDPRPLFSSVLAKPPLAVGAWWAGVSTRSTMTGRGWRSCTWSEASPPHSGPRAHRKARSLPAQ